MERKKLTVPDLFKMKKEKHKITMLSAPDATTASLIERAGIDVVVLGDSLGMVAMGYSTTLPVTMEDMVFLGKAVRRGAPNTFVLASMPYQSYQTPEMALYNAKRFMQEVGADAVKIQGGKRVKPILQALADAAIPCMSHVGLVPHALPVIGGFKVQGRTAVEAKSIYDDALAVQEAGAIGVEIEAVPPIVAAQITRDLNIITYGIGAGSECDGQVLLAWDMLGFFDTFKPKFVKRYAAVGQMAIQAMVQFAEEVRSGRFPDLEHTYAMDDKEAENFKKFFQ